MNQKIFSARIWKLLGWSVISTVLLMLLLLPLSHSLLSLNDDSAFAQSVPPSKEPKETPVPTPGPPGPGPAGPPLCSTGCVFQLPPEMPTVEVEYLKVPPLGIPPLTHEGVIVRVPATLPITPVQVALPVPSGFITEPVGLIPFDFGPLGFRELGTLVVPTKPLTDLIVRIEILPKEGLPVPVNDPQVIPPDWYADPHLRQFELGYGAPMAVRAPGVTQQNYQRYAVKAGLPVSPIPPPDAATAGVIPTQPFSGTVVNVEAVFNLTVYDGTTGQQISIHLPELILVRCFERNYDPYTPVLLRANGVLNQYDLPVQAHNRSTASLLSERITAYLLDTSTTFVVATLAGQVRPVLVPGSSDLPLNPVAIIPPDPPQSQCNCNYPLPPGLPLANVQAPDVLPAGVPPLTGDGVMALVKAAKPIEPPLAAIPVPSGVITEPVGLIYFDLRPAFRAFCTLIVPADAKRDKIVRLEILRPDSVLIPINAPGVIPPDWYVVPHPQVWPELGYGAPTPIRAPGVVASNYARYAARVGLPTSPIPPPDAAAAGVISTLPYTGNAVRVDAIMKINLYYADNGEEITIYLPELILGDFCFEPNLSPYTPVLLRTDQPVNRYDIPVQRYWPVTASALYHERFTTYLLDPSIFVIASLSGQVRPPLSLDQQGRLNALLRSYQSGIPSPIIPAGLPNTGEDNPDN